MQICCFASTIVYCKALRTLKSQFGIDSTQSLFIHDHNYMINNKSDSQQFWTTYSPGRRPWGRASSHFAV